MMIRRFQFLSLYFYFLILNALCKDSAMIHNTVVIMSHWSHARADKTLAPRQSGVARGDKL